MDSSPVIPVRVSEPVSISGLSMRLQEGVLKESPVELKETSPSARVMVSFRGSNIVSMRPEFHAISSTLDEVLVCRGSTSTLAVGFRNTFLMRRLGLGECGDVVVSGIVLREVVVSSSALRDLDISLACLHTPVLVDGC